MSRPRDCSFVRGTFGTHCRWAVGLLVDLGLSFRYAAAAAASMTLLGAEFGLLALAVGAVTGRRGPAITIAGVAAVASYVLFALGALVEEVEPWRFLSPFQHAMGTDPILNGMSAGASGTGLWARKNARRRWACWSTAIRPPASR